MKMITIAAAMALAATPAFAATQIRASYDRSTTVQRVMHADTQRCSRRPRRAYEATGCPHVPAGRSRRFALSASARSIESPKLHTGGGSLPPGDRSLPEVAVGALVAMYFRAFSLYQTGTVDRMRESRDVLTALAKNYPNADLADAKTLRTRVCGELPARRRPVRAEVSEMAKRTETGSPRARPRAVRKRGAPRTTTTSGSRPQRAAADGQRACHADPQESARAPRPMLIRAASEGRGSSRRRAVKKPPTS
jgi:hypothetical protein